MLIDDNKIDLFVTQRILENVLNDTEVNSFESPFTALKALKLMDLDQEDEKFIPDVIFVDINMPGMNGFELLEAYNNLENLKKRRIKIYILTSSTFGEDIKKAKEIKSCVGYINKPLNRQAINNVMAELMFSGEDCNEKNKSFRPMLQKPKDYYKIA